jgi:hypothetical protein
MTLISDIHHHAYFLKEIIKEGKLNYINVGPDSNEEWMIILKVLEAFEKGDAQRLERIKEDHQNNGVDYLMMKRLAEAAKLMEA